MSVVFHSDRPIEGEHPYNWHSNLAGIRQYLMAQGQRICSIRADKAAGKTNTFAPIRDNLWQLPAITPESKPFRSNVIPKNVPPV